MRKSQQNLRNSGGLSRRGSVLVYSFVLMAVMLGFISFGVDFGRIQAIKTELQRDADATARGCLQMYISYGGESIPNAYASFLASNSYNPVDGKSGVAAYVEPIVWGIWDPIAKTFTPTGGTPNAIKIVISRSTLRGNPVKLTFPLMNGLFAVKQTCDVAATSIAVMDGSANASATISGQGDPWLAGMASGSGAVSDGDTAPAQSPPLVMNVIPGTVLTFTNVSGAVTNDPSILPVSADGNSSAMHSHNDDDPLGESGVQNNIGNIIAPINALIGVFLTSNAPNTQTAPTVERDYTTQAARDQTNFSDIQLQQPFFVGDGQTSGGTTQTFVVPAGATRLYLGTMDGHQWSNNSGSFAATINQQQGIFLVK